MRLEGIPPASSMSYVLLVEDEALIAALLRNKIEPLSDRRFVSCSAVAQAFEHVSKDLPDIAFLDVNLGDDTCFELALALQRHCVPIYFLTSYSKQSLKALGLPDALESVEILSKFSTLSKYVELLGALDQ